MQRFREGETIYGRYRVIKQLGSGGMGDVYFAKDTQKGGTTCAVKILRTGQRGEEIAQARFLIEALILRDVTHEHVVTYYEAIIPKSMPPFLVMEYLSGGTVAQLLEQARARAWPPFTLPSGLTRGVALELVRQCAAGLAHAHALEVAHRDLKPSNILLCDPVEQVLATGEIRIKIADFGIAATHAIGSSNLTRPGAFVGTLPFGAPEHLEHVIEVRRGRKKASRNRLLDEEKKGDMFALGLVMYEVWTGRPFLERAGSMVHGAGNELEAVLQALQKELENFHRRMSQLRHPDPEVTLMASLLERDPDKRPSAAETATRLGNLIAPDILAVARETYSGTYSTLASMPEVVRSSGVDTISRAPVASESGPASHRPTARRAALGTLAVLVVAWVVWWGTGRGPKVLEHPLSGGLLPTPRMTVPVRVADKQTAGPKSGETAAPTSSPFPNRDDTQAEPSPQRGAVAPAQSTPEPRRRKVLPEGKRVRCTRWGDIGLREQRALQKLGKTANMLKGVTIWDLVCRSDGQGGTFVEKCVQPGSQVFAPYAGTLRLDSGRRPLGGAATCVVLDHGEQFFSKICGFDSRKIYVTPGSRLRRGQVLGRLDKKGCLTYQLFFEPPGESGNGQERRIPLDVRPLLAR